jgi:thymidylate synthase
MNTTKCFFSAGTIDDLMQDAMSEILNHGTATRNIKGNTTELSGVLLELTNPRARLSRSEARGKVYGCLGEFCWYMSGTGDPEFIKYYLKKYDKCIENGTIHGAYGPRLFNWKGGNQFENVITLLSNKKRQDTRKAVLQLFDSTDLYKKHEDIPCTCTFQFFVRDGKLLMNTSMRVEGHHIPQAGPKVFPTCCVSLAIV